MIISKSIFSKIKWFQNDQRFMLIFMAIFIILYILYILYIYAGFCPRAPTQVSASAGWHAVTSQWFSLSIILSHLIAGSVAACLAGWRVCWMANCWLVDLLAVWLPGCLASRLNGWLASRRFPGGCWLAGGFYRGWHWDRFWVRVGADTFSMSVC